MHVALVHMRHAHSGGTERYMNQLARYLAEKGHQVTIVCRSHENPPHPSVKFEVLKGFSIGNAARMWRFARDVERHMASHRYDVVFGLGKTWSHDVTRLGGGCQEIYLQLGHPATQNWFGRVFGPGRKYVDSLKVEKRALAPGAYRFIITNSRWVKQHVMQLHDAPENRIRLVYNGVDLDRFNPRNRVEGGQRLREELGLAPENFVLLHLGSGYARKGVDRVLQAFAPFSERHPNARLMIVGYDSGWRRYERQARKLGVLRKVRFLGGRRDAENAYAAADLYVLATRFDPFANTTLEALATGLPVITTDSNGASEILNPEVGSVVPAEGSLQPLAEAMERWYQQAGLPQVKLAARNLAEKYPSSLTASRSAEVLVEAFQERTATSGRTISG